MTTTNLKNEASAPANVRPSSVSKTRAFAAHRANRELTIMNTTPIFPGLDTLVKPFQFPATPYEYKVTPLRECPTPDDLIVCDTPAKAAEYWRMHIADHPYFNPECECFVALMLNTRRRVKGHYLV